MAGETRCFSQLLRSIRLPVACNFQPATVNGSHAICIVGYTPDRFIIRNSWGEDWGHEGFGYASQPYIADGFFDEAYGITA
jgi:C1A family cysteine protease